MTFHLIGLGLDINTISVEARLALKECKKIYLENYTVDFPYDTGELDRKVGKTIEHLGRKEVESEEFLKDAKDDEIALLVYGDSLSATTHTQLIITCKRQNIPFKVYHNASILTAVAQTGLQLYKFGKTASMPKWDKEKNYTPTSFMNYYKENDSIKAHTLLLTDIGLDINHAMFQLQKACNIEGFELNKNIIIISKAGLKDQKIYYDNIARLSKVNIEKPFCIIIPSELHFIEEEALEEFREQLY